MTSSSAVRFSRVSFLCTIALAACSVRLVSSVPTVPQQEEGASSGFSTVMWSVLNGCFDSDSADPIVVCLKSKALTALDRALVQPTLAVADGVALAARDSKSLADPLTEKVDRAALEAARDLDHKSAMLDTMLANRMNEFMSTRAIVLDTQEGRSRRKDQRMFARALMMAGMLAVAVLGPMTFGFVALLASKALLIGKIALLLSSFLSLKQLYQPQKSVHPTQHYDRRIELVANNRAYSGQLNQ